MMGVALAAVAFCRSSLVGSCSICLCAGLSEMRGDKGTGLSPV